MLKCLYTDLFTQPGPMFNFNLKNRNFLPSIDSSSMSNHQNECVNTYKECLLKKVNTAEHS